MYMLKYSDSKENIWNSLGGTGRRRDQIDFGDQTLEIGSDILAYTGIC